MSTTNVRNNKEKMGPDDRIKELLVGIGFTEKRLKSVFLKIGF